jgi:hypothetical protein
LADTKTNLSQDFKSRLGSINVAMGQIISTKKLKFLGLFVKMVQETCNSFPEISAREQKISDNK